MSYLSKSSVKDEQFSENLPIKAVFYMNVDGNADDPPRQNTQTRRYRLFWKKPTSDEIANDPAKYFVEKMHRGRSYPRCWNCYSQHLTIADHDMPSGDEAEMLVPCGCPFKEAMFEEFLQMQGWLCRERDIPAWVPEEDRASIPTSLGKQRAFLLNFFESMFGSITPEMLIHPSPSAFKSQCKKYFSVKGPMHPSKMPQDVRPPVTVPNDFAPTRRRPKKPANNPESSNPNTPTTDSASTGAA